MAEIEGREWEFNRDCGAAERAYYRLLGKAAKNEWDIAAADTVDSISPEQEYEIRTALGREMGLAPSEVDGWREIYERRAKLAKAKNAKQDAETTEAFKRMNSACSRDMAESGRKFEIKRELAAIERERLQELMDDR
ncbi:MAG: hypothetical protein SXU28_11255 [Pseudomonadota bacterium]|nr:hypothetical protein [Pseudomonadota bacterium]